MRATTLTMVCGLAMTATLASGQLTNPSFEIPGSTSVFDGWTTFENAVPEFTVARTGAAHADPAAIVDLTGIGRLSGPPGLTTPQAEEP